MGIDDTVQAVFDKAMYLIDANNDSSGLTDTADTREYKVKTIGILNSLIDLVYPYSDTYRLAEDRKRSSLPDLQSFDDHIDLDPMICRAVLPNGLAAKLLTTENPALADYFQQCFEEALAAAKRGIRSEWSDIEDLYGGIEHGEFGNWSNL